MTTSDPTNGSGGQHGGNGNNGNGVNGNGNLNGVGVNGANGYSPNTAPNTFPSSIPNSVPNGLPDESLLTQLANEMFRALPGLTQNPGDITSSAERSLPSTFPSIPHANGIDSLVLPSEADLRQLPARMSIGTGAPLPPGVSALSPGAVPVGFNANDFSTSTPADPMSLGFLNEIRPLLSYGQIDQAAVTAVNPQSGMSAYPQSDVTALSALGAPQIPGTVAHANGVNQFNQPNYPDQARFPDSQYNQQPFNERQFNQQYPNQQQVSQGQFNQQQRHQQQFSQSNQQQPRQAQFNQSSINSIDPVQAAQFNQAGYPVQTEQFAQVNRANPNMAGQPNQYSQVAQFDQYGNPALANQSYPMGATQQPQAAQIGQLNQFMTPGTVNQASQFNKYSPVQQPFSFDYQNPLAQVSRADVVPSLAPYDRTSSGGIGNLNLSSPGNFDVEAIRRDFPILQERVNGHQLVWLDNAATTQKPTAVIDRLSFFYSHENSNIHRAAHALAARATDAYESARESVRRFLNAPSVQEIVFARGATEAINLVARTWGQQNIGKDDEIVISWLEHHANIVPWQMLCAEKGARLRVAPVDDNGQILLDQYERLLGPKTKLVSITQVSNALGTVTPIKSVVDAAHRYGARVLVDGAQAVSHMQIDLQSLDCDFYVFSGHKVYAPTGIGVLFGKAEVLESMPPWQGGGNMIKDVTFERTLYQDPPLRFEAGTGSIGDAVGLGAAIDYVQRIGMANIGRHEHELLVYATEGLKRIPGLRLIGTAPDKAGVLSFVLDGYRTEEVSEALNREGIAVRAGHHCAQPILRRFGLESTVRPSLGIYNTCQDIDALIAAVWNLKQGRNPGPL
jgi:cysteine desulfurase/selenocysteine lyase